MDIACLPYSKRDSGDLNEFGLPVKTEFHFQNEKRTFKMD